MPNKIISLHCDFSYTSCVFSALVGVIYFSEHFLQMLGFIAGLMDFHIKQTSEACGGRFKEGGMPILPAFTMTKTMIILAIGISYDFKLVNLLKKRKNQIRPPGQASIVPWKSSNKIEKVNIPLEATLAASLGIGVWIVIGYFCVLRWFFRYY